MKPQPSICVLVAVVAAGALLLGCEGGIEQLAPDSASSTELIAAYVDPITPTPGSQRARDGGDADKLPLLDGDPQDDEWSVALPLYVYLSGDQANGGRNFYVEVRALWSDDSRWADGTNHLYLLVRYNDETMDILPDYWRYARRGPFGVDCSPIPYCPGDACCDSIIIEGANWFQENIPAAEDQLALMWEITPASDALGSYGEHGCQVACHGGHMDGPTDGRFDLWVWRAGRTNAQESTIYPDTARINYTGDYPDGRPESFYPLTDPSTAWPGYMEDMSLDAAGTHRDAADPNFVYRKYGYTGLLYTKNETAQSRDGRLIPRWITEKMETTGRAGTGIEEEVVPPNGGLPGLLYLWGPTAQTFGPCDVIATSQTSSTDPHWSQHPPAGGCDGMPGYLLWIPNGGAADVRAKGAWVTNSTKRFPVCSVEIRRPMITRHADDIVIDPTKEYTFTVAAFDGSSTIHSGSRPIRLKFQPSPWATSSSPGRVNP